MSFGFCQETSPPSQCAPLSFQDTPSPALEQCCLDSGNCCDDLFDLDGDGNYDDSIGSCGRTPC